MSLIATRSDRHTGRGLLLVAAAAVVWSTGGLFVRSLDTNDPWVTIFWRSVFASLSLGTLVAVLERGAIRTSFRRMGQSGVMVGGCFAVSSIGLVVALHLTSVANTLVILSTAPVLAALFGRMLLGDAIQGRTWWASAGVLVGVGVMAQGSAGSGSLLGDAVALIIPTGFALATVIIRRHHEVGMMPAMLIGTVMAAVVAAPLTGSFAVSGHDLALLAGFGGIELGAGMALYVTGARFAAPADATLVSLLEVILGPIWVWLVVNERPSTAAIFGGGLVLVAVIVHTSLDPHRGEQPLLAQG